MRGRPAAAVLAALLLTAMALSAAADTLVPAAARRIASPIRGLALGAGEGAGVALARSPYWPLNVQPWYTVNLSLDVPVVSFFGLGFSLGFRGTGDSDPATGVLYRGHHGLETGAYLYGRGRLARAGDRLDLLGGIIAGSSANFEVYSLTELLFFYPSVLVEPYLELHFPRLGAHTVSLSLPARLDFRRDLELSASVGLGLRWRWYPKHNKEQP
jgi:hypothetical protein